MNCKVGDWVRFYKDGTLIISEVRGITKDDGYPYKDRALTLDGAVAFADVVERRGAPTEPPRSQKLVEVRH